MQRELNSFLIPPNQKFKLQNAGFITVEDIIGLKPSEISKELEISLDEALDILKLVCEDDPCHSKPGNKAATSRSALDMLKDEQLQQNIITFSEQLDEILGGGVPLTKITEFCGAPGIGKTQLCLQLCVDVQIPPAFGGVGGEAVFIDTEGSFLVDRLADICSATVSHCQQIAKVEQGQEQVSALADLTLEALLAGVFYFRCHDYVQLLATVHTLSEFLKEHPKVRLVVVDSIAFHFRHDFEDFSLRTRLLNSLAQNFNKMAAQYRLAVVLTNQMTTKVGGGSSHLIPALGESWGHAATIRVILYWRNHVRHALLYKSPSKQEASVSYQITTGGIRDLYEVEEQRPDIATLQMSQEEQPKKRQKLNH